MIMSSVCALPILSNPRAANEPFARRARFRWPTATGLLFLLVYACSSFVVFGADSSHCDICGKPHGLTIYTATDKVTREKVFICYECATWADECYICGLPARDKATPLPDGRFLCARDARTAVLDEAKAKETCEAMRDTLEHMLSRFLTLPSTNVTVALVDRVDLYDELAVVGNDFECPDILGYIHSRTNQTGLSHAISLMSALPLGEFRATCAHEYDHAWVFENVSPERRKRLNRDAHEGFCELLAYLLVDSLHDDDQLKRMLRNTYTRGQINLFIAAEKEFGLNDILDWMRWGVNPRLKAADPGDIRNVVMPRLQSPTATNQLVYAQHRAPAPTNLVLKGISAGGNQTLALINDQTLAVGESAKVRLGATNVLVRCLAIGARSARVQAVDSGQVFDLQLTEGANR